MTHSQNDRFDMRASPDKPIWFMVDVQNAADLARPLTRDVLRDHPILAGMDVLRKGNRLSIQPVTEEQWQAVLEMGGAQDHFV
ncbi:EVE domain-containing protein [Geoalkalibacter subterraneus]|uniref:EVE domain-containing protein n=1 Tax=Geoalkalibacter subterraneus TaxID=483547 RepID=UPI0006939D73|nr:EVE domain-containing protein [Geoalkalibacter subterraneus]